MRSGRSTNTISEIFIQIISLNFPLMWHNLFILSKHIASNNLFPQHFDDLSLLLPILFIHQLFLFFSQIYSHSYPALVFASFTFLLGGTQRKVARGAKWNCTGGRVLRPSFSETCSAATSFFPSLFRSMYINVF